MRLKRDTYEDLVEALRRYTRNHDGEELTEAWTGLGNKTSYRGSLRDGYMTWVHGTPTPGTIGWLRLTNSGAKIVGEWLAQGFTYKDIEGEPFGQNTRFPNQNIEVI